MNALTLNESMSRNVGMTSSTHAITGSLIRNIRHLFSKKLFTANSCSEHRSEHSQIKKVKTLMVAS